MSLPFHPDTKKSISTLQADLPHALLISGPEGVGIHEAANILANGFHASTIEPTNAKGDIDYTSGSISVELIRQLYDKTRAKTTKKQVHILHGAERLSLGAQAAFLKLLEEPNTHTHFILTSHAPQALLPTIRSRVQTLSMRRITKQQTKAYIESLGVADAQLQNQLTFLASGLPEEITRLVADESYFTLRAETMADTRVFLTGSVYEKLLIIQKYHQSRPKALQLVSSAIMVTKRSLLAHPQPNLIETLEHLSAIEQNIAANCNVRLQLTAFVVQ